MYELSDARVIQALELLRKVLNERISIHSQLFNQETQEVR
jgi:hypothetical protein